MRDSMQTRNNRIITWIAFLAATVCLIGGNLPAFAQAGNRPPDSAMAQTSIAQGTPGSGARSPEQKQQYRRAMEQADQQIADEIKQHSELIRNLQHLTTQIGARLTGSPNMQKASEWTLQRFKDYGVDAHLETTQIPHGYQRGIDTASIVSPVQKMIGV